MPVIGYPSIESEGKELMGATPGGGGHRPATQAAVDDDIAFRLLQMQQKLEAWDRLYNEEIGSLRRDLAEMKADYVQRWQAQKQTEKPTRPKKTRR